MWLISHYCNIVDYGKFLTYKRLRNSLCLTKAEGGGWERKRGAEVFVVVVVFSPFL